MDFFAIQLIIMAIFGGIASTIASNRGRSPVGWFFGGFFLTWIGIIIVLVIPNLKEQAAKEEAIARENRRLREQLLQEQMKSEAFRQHAAARLDAHDTHLGLDTRASSPALTGPAQSGAPLNLGAENWPGQQPAVSDPAMFAAQTAAAATSAGPPRIDPAASAPPARQWYYSQDGQSVGPVDEAMLFQLIRDRQITAQSLLWTPLLSDWKIASEFDFLRPWLNT